MKITFDTSTDGADQASDLVAILVNLYSLTPTPVTAANYVKPKEPGVDPQPTGTLKIDPPAAGQLPVVPPGPELDSQGVPYDERIHSGGRSKNKEGAWNRKRGVSEMEYARVLTEIMARKEPAPAVPAPTAALPQVPAATQQPVVPPVPPTPAPTSDLTWQQVCAVLTEKITSGKVTTEELNVKARELGVEPFALIGQQPALWRAAHDWLSSK